MALANKLEKDLNEKLDRNICPRTLLEIVEKTRIVIHDLVVNSLPGTTEMVLHPPKPHYGYQIGLKPKDCCEDAVPLSEKQLLALVKLWPWPAAGFLQLLKDFANKQSSLRFDVHVEPVLYESSLLHTPSTEYEACGKELVLKIQPVCRHGASWAFLAWLVQIEAPSNDGEPAKDEDASPDSELAKATKFRQLHCWFYDPLDLHQQKSIDGAHPGPDKLKIEGLVSLEGLKDLPVAPLDVINTGFHCYDALQVMIKCLCTDESGSTVQQVVSNIKYDADKLTIETIRPQDMAVA